MLDANGNPIDNQCISCHAFTYIDPADGVTVLPPAGQLELTDGPSLDEPDHFHAYRELLVTDNLQESRPTFVIPQAAPQQMERERPEMHTNSPEGAPKVETFRREQPKVGRNEPCPCGSGKKFKKCCGKE